jgi:hypothetical protein
MMRTKKILIICRNELASAPRFMMEVNSLKHDFELIGAGDSAPVLTKDYHFIDISKKRKVYDFHFKYPYFLKKATSLVIRLFLQLRTTPTHLEYNYKVLDKLNYDLIIVHHFFDLELAVKLALKRKIKIIFNAHEYYPLEFDNDPVWMELIHPQYTKIADDFLKHIDLCFCVGEKIAQKYFSEYKLKSVIVNNSKPFYDLKPCKTGSKIKIVHHGAAIRERGLELMFDIMNILGESYELNIVLMPNEDDYMNFLMEKGASIPNVIFHSPVETEKIPLFLNSFDIGLFLLPPANFNYKYALPNKFFEFIQARLAIAVGPSPEMKSLVEKYDLGVVSEDFSPERLANLIKNLSIEKIEYFKGQSHKHAKELSSEKTEMAIRNAVINILK